MSSRRDHVVSSVNFENDDCTCACGWSGTPDTFAAHRYQVGIRMFGGRKLHSMQGYRGNFAMKTGRVGT